MTLMRRRGDRGATYPSPVVMLSIIAIAMAAVAYLATRSQPRTEQEIETVARPAASASPSAQPAPTPAPRPTKPPLRRGAVSVEIYNNSGITGLAGQTAADAAEIGWNVVGTDNWYGTVPNSTVYYPPALKRAARQLALDLGIERLMPAIETMSADRLTVVLTAPLG